MPVTEERVTSNRFHFAIPVVSIAESKKFYCDFMGCQAGNAEEGKWQDINFWDNELTLHQAHDVLPRESHDVDMGRVCVPHFGVHLSREDFDALKAKIEASSEYDYYDKHPYTFNYAYNEIVPLTWEDTGINPLVTNGSLRNHFYDISITRTKGDDLYLKAVLTSDGNESPIIRRLRFER